jgi:protein-tyrosine phosphatase
MTALPNPPTSAPLCRPSRSRWIAGLIGVLALASIVPVYWSIELYRANWGVVVPGRIFRSAQMPPMILREKLLENHIRLILFLSHDDLDDADVQAEKSIAAEQHVRFVNYPMMGDGVAAPEMYTRALRVLCAAVRAGQPVLVHCHSGAQRTGGVVAVYRMLVEKVPPDRALAEMKRFGHDPRRNLTLVPFLNKHMGQWALALQRAGVIDRVPDPLPQLVVN